MVRYRSRRDFVRFAIRANQADKFMHKWAAIEKTHVFPVKPLISLLAVRTLVALSLFTIGLILNSVL
jgi:Arc/MetJ-type ribon-helix-helix transcriptional regulator